MNMNVNVVNKNKNGNVMSVFLGKDIFTYMSMWSLQLWNFEHGRIRDYYLVEGVILCYKFCWLCVSLLIVGICFVCI